MLLNFDESVLENMIVLWPAYPKYMANIYLCLLPMNWTVLNRGRIGITTNIKWQHFQIRISVCQLHLDIAFRFNRSKATNIRGKRPLRSTSPHSESQSSNVVRSVLHFPHFIPRHRRCMYIHMMCTARERTSKGKQVREWVNVCFVVVCLCFAYAKRRESFTSLRLPARCITVHCSLCWV